MKNLVEAVQQRRDEERLRLDAECRGGCGRVLRRLHEKSDGTCSGCRRKAERALAKKPKQPEEKELTQAQHEELMRRIRDVFAFANSLNVKMKVDLRFPPHAKRRRGTPADAIPARGEL